MFLFVLALVAVPISESPMATGYREMSTVLSAQKLQAWIPRITATINPKLGTEVYAVKSDGKTVSVQGGDQNGAMYGMMELAERAHNQGAAAFKKGGFSGSPYLIDRGWNLFLPLPWDYAKNFNDPDPAALIDPQRWFFQNEDYWKKLFHQMAWSRLNWLDIHGPYDLDTTRFPNLYAYFIQSDKFPKVGVSPEIKAKNLERLRWVIRLAHSYGIRVSLMSYEARFDIPHNPNPGYRGTEQEIYDYTREVVAKMIKQVPELDKIGYRIGESGRGAEFFKCYGEAVKDSGRDIPIYCRSWVTTKARVVPLARASKDFTVEIKYNGEQWGAPYIMQGGRVANWYSYFWEDYLSYSGPQGAKMWPGNPGEGVQVVRYSGVQGLTGGKSIASKTQHLNTRTPENPSRWPSQPYKIVWQVRANGTHRIFPFYQPEWTRRSIKSMKVGTTTGYTIESMESYFPQQPAYYMKDPSKAGFTWNFERDEMYMTCWGRLGYDPAVPEKTFDAMLVRRFGKKVGEPLSKAWKAASKVVPLAYMAYSLGPDHRNHAPELEWGGDTEAYIQGEPFDSHVFKSAREDLGIRASGGKDGRLSLDEAATVMASAQHEGMIDFRSNQSSNSGSAAANRVAGLWASNSNLLCLAGYYLSKGQAAMALARFQASNEKPQLALAALKAKRAEANWRQVIESDWSDYYKPFTDRLRMGTHSFSWKSEFPKIESDANQLSKLAEGSSPAKGFDITQVPSPLPKSAHLIVTWNQGAVYAAIPSNGLKAAWLLHKPQPSSTFFHKQPMRILGDKFVLAIPRESWGHCIAAEIQMTNGVIRRIPWWETEQPYITVPSMEKPTPYFYSAEEAMRYLDPKVLNPKKYGWLVVAQRGWNFFRSFDAQTKRKLVSAVENGMTLLLLQQDYTSGRYPLDWLPVKPNVVNKPGDTFDPGGALGLSKFETKETLFQPLSPTPGWEVFGNGGVARMKYGKGVIWMVQARFSQRLHIPDVARNLRKLLVNTTPQPLTTGPSAKLPAIILDSGTEGGSYTTSLLPDFMNAHDLPFLTLGEVIAREQGMNSVTPIPGPVSDDAVLNGKGPEIMKNFLEAMVHAAAARPLPKSTAEVEQRRPVDRKEFMRMMGLDPLPPRTPLNARITGTFHRSGYRVEKLVYESRPGFFVTGLLYIPEPPTANGQPPTRFPVILDVHGHWSMKKQQDVVQSRCIFQALHGYVAFCIDTPGHSFEADDAPIERRWQGQHNDWTLLLGSANTTALYAWDGIRALDYLETRAECDMTKVGITGASGGGLATVYNFIADERIKVAVPVVYATSLEVNPHNGCLCNHVPGTLQVGDRSDLLAIRAPNPILVIGATVDTEFPPAGTQKTGEKLRAIWKLFGKEEDAQWKVFPGGHDDNQAMQELAVGFFDKHLRGIGDGSPVQRPAFKTEPERSAAIQVLGAITPNAAITQRDISLQRLRDAKTHTWEDVIKLNGGLPKSCDLKWNAHDARDSQKGTLPYSGKSFITYQSEEGLTIPAVAWSQAKNPKAIVIFISENGKAAAPMEFGISDLVKSGYDCTAIDVRGYGELQGLDQRLMTYLGTADAFAMGWDAAVAAKHLHSEGAKVIVVGQGAVASQAAMFAALFEPSISGVIGLGALKRWEDVFTDGVPSEAVMPRADLAAPLEVMRSWVKAKSIWNFKGEPGVDLKSALDNLLSR